MRFLLTLLVAVVLIASLVPACGMEPSSNLNSIDSNFNGLNKESELAKVTRTLQEISPAIAKTLFENKDIFNLVVDESNQKKTREYEALFNDIRNTASSVDKRLTFEDLLDDRFNGKRGNLKARTPISKKIAKIPNFNFLVYVPDGMSRAELDPARTVVVANRYDVEDTEYFEVTGYNALGQKVILNSKEKPDFPVIVLGISERVGLNPQSYEPLQASNGMLQYAGPVYLSEIYLEKDNEGWLSGKPEVFAWYSSPVTNNAFGLEREYPHVNKEKYPYSFYENISVANWQVCFHIIMIEHDPGSRWIEVHPPVYCMGQIFSSGFLINGADDPYGMAIIPGDYTPNQQFDLGAARVRFTR